MKLVDVPEGLGTVFVSLPLKVEGGPEAETRVMAIVPSSTPSQSL
jgi:kynurenine formamidase